MVLDFISLFAFCKKEINSSPLKASQNSSCAVPCNNFFILSTSLAPGNSNEILAELPILWITGDNNPSGSTLFLKTCSADSILSSILISNTDCTSSSDISDVISSLNVLFEKIETNFKSPLISSNAIKKSSRYVF